MKRILEWLEAKFSRHSAATEAAEGQTPVCVRVNRMQHPEDEYTIEISCGIEMNDTYTCDDTAAQRQLDDLNEPPADAGGSARLDP
jgi:hypothetical protein